MKSHPEKSTPPKVREDSVLLGSIRKIERDALAFLLEEQARLGDRFSFRLAVKRVFFFAHPDDVAVIYRIKGLELSKTPNRRRFGRSVLTSDGADWTKLRRQSQPFFSKKTLEAWFPLTLETIDRHLSLATQSPETDLHHFLTRVIHDLVLQILFGYETTEDLPDLGADIEAITSYVVKTSGLPFRLPEWAPFQFNRDYQRARDAFLSLAEKILLKNKGTKPKYPSFFESFNEESDDAAKGFQALTFFLAGFETTVNALFWTTLLLLRNPKEIEGLITEARANPTKDVHGFADLEKYPRIRSVILEGMRLYPPVWFRTRIATEPLTINGAEIPKGGLVWVSPFVSHRHPSAWTDAERFDPSRWAKNPEPSEGAYFPFSQGKNMCIGREMAMMEMTLFLARVFGKYQIETLDPKQLTEVKTRAFVTIQPDRPLRVRISLSECP